MKRVGLLVTTALVVAILLPVTALAGPKVQSYTAVVTDDGGCTLTATGTWPASAKVTNPLAAWYWDGTDLAHFVFSQDTDPNHANPGTIRKNTVRFTVGPLTADTVSHDWIVRLDFYDSRGALLNQTWSSPLSVGCTVGG